MNQFERVIHEEIDDICNEIQIMNQSLQKVTNQSIDEINFKKQLEQKKAVNKTYALKQFISKQTYIKNQKLEKEMLREIQKESNTETVIKNIDNMDNFMEQLTQDSYKKKWTRLDNWQKKQKIIEYYEYLLVNNAITIEKMNSIKNDISPIYIKELSKYIDYDEENGKIKNIKI